MTHILWLKQEASGVPAPHSVPTIALHSSLFLQKHLTGGVLISEVRGSS